MGKLGSILIAIGVMTADNECLLVPFAAVALGFFVLWRGGYVG